MQRFVRHSIRIKFMLAVVLSLSLLMWTGMHRLNRIEAMAFEQEVHQRTTVVSSFGQAAQTYVNEQLRPAVEAETDEWIVEATSSPYVTRSLFERFNQMLPEYQYRQPTLNPLNLDNQADSFEANIIEQLRQNRSLTELSGYRTDKGEETYYVARPVKIEAACLRCHGRVSDAPAGVIAKYGTEHGYNWQLDDVVSALMIYVPTVDLRANQANVQRTLIGLFSLLTLLSAGAVLVLFDRLIHRRISRLGAALKRRALSPETSVRLSDTSGDELGRLAGQFNQMAEAFDQVYQTLEEKVRDRTSELTQTLHMLKGTQAQLVQAEKMSSLGTMVGGIAHEINNPASFIHGNLDHARNYFRAAIALIEQFQQELPSERQSARLQAEIEDAEIAYITEDFDRLLGSMQSGTERIRTVVKSLRNFARLDETDRKTADIHAGIDSTLTLLNHRLAATERRAAITLVKTYGDLPQISCFPGQLNQVFFHLLSNAIDALETVSDRPPTLTITTSRTDMMCRIAIQDNGIGMTESVCLSAFDPFFTTKEVGQGQGLGLSVSYQIVVDLHGGQLRCESMPGQGATFIVELPL